MSCPPEPAGWPAGGPGGWYVALAFELTDADPAIFDPFEAALTDPIHEGRTSFALVRDETAWLWRIRAVLPDRPPADWLEARLAEASAASGLVPSAVAVEKLPETDWVVAVNRASPAITTGPFHVRGTHIAEPAPAGLYDIVLDAGAAFGTGSHETTRGCLLAIAAADPPPQDAPLLDLGTGSGLLAIAMALHWGKDVLASDSDAIAVAVAAENALANGVGANRVGANGVGVNGVGGNGVAGRVRTCRSLGFANRRLRTAAPYGFIAANILARPLIRMAPAIARHLRGDGRAVLSGIIAEQERSVAEAYARSGLDVLDRVVLGDWPTLVVGRE